MLAIRPSLPTTKRQLVSAARASAQRSLHLAPEKAASHLVMSKVELHESAVRAAGRWARSALEIEANNHVGNQLLELVAQREGRIGQAADHLVNTGRANPRGNSVDLLRRLRVAGPVVGFGAIFGARALLRGFNAAGVFDSTVVVTIVVVLVVAVLAAAVFFSPPVARRRARSKMSNTARALLETDRATRPWH